MIALLFYPNNKRQLKNWFLLHLGIGFLGLISKFFIIIWFYLVLIQAIFYINSERSKDAKHLRIINLLLYIAPFEIITRILDCSPFIPYELGKYITFILFIWGLSFSRQSNKTGYILIALLIPGIIIGWFKATDYRYIVFNIMGLINLGLGIAYFGGLFLIKAKYNLNNGLRLFLYPLSMALIYTFIKTPDYEEMDFHLGANFEASGGFGSNQVSTAFGVGMFLCFYMWQQGTSFSGFGRLADLVSSGLFLFQGLLTFSRGGVIGGILAILLYSIWSRNYLGTTVKNKLKNVNLGKIVFFVIPILFLLTIYVNTMTKGNLLLRYQGETYGTMLGTKENDLNNLTSGRSDIFLGDLMIFLDYPIFGSGVSISSQIRSNQIGAAAHVELSRLLAEHGFFGVIVFLVIIKGLLSFYFNKNNRMVILLILSIVGVYTTFHSATRTFLSPLLISIAYIPVRSLKLN